MNGDARGVLAPVIRKLEHIHKLTEEELGTLVATASHVESFGAREGLIREGDRPNRCFALLEGVTSTFKIVRNGRRQITAFQVPGDIPDLQSLHHQICDAGITSITPCKVAFIPHRVVLDLCARYPRLASAFWRETLTEASIYREWVTNIGQRDAMPRIAHLFCEFLVRMNVAGLANDFSCRFPIAQHELANATGMSAVHVNRSIQDLRAHGLISLQNGVLKALDWPALKNAADFDPVYLHLDEAE